MRLKSSSKAPSREQRVIKVVAAAPQSVQKILKDAFSGAASPRRAIQAMCLACTSYDRAAIRDCTGWSCPLWAYRPYRRNRDEAQAT